MIGPLGAFRRGTPCHVTATSRRTVVGWGRIVRMTPTIVARYDQDALEIATLDGQTCRTVGVHITVECPVDSKSGPSTGPPRGAPAPHHPPRTPADHTAGGRPRTRRDTP